MKITVKHIYIFTSAILLLLSLYYFMDTLRVINNIEHITATITELDSNNNIGTIEYTYNDTTYTQQIPLQENYGLNDEIEIIIDKTEPSYLEKKEPNIQIPRLTVIVSSALLIISVASYLNDIKNKMKIYLLKRNGIYIEANIEEIMVNGKGKPKRGKYPYRIRCIYTNPTDKSVFRFETEDLYFNVNEYINEYNIKKFPIYVDKKNYKNYYIDLYYLKKKK